MELYIISKKSDFNEDKIKRLEQFDKIVFLEKIGSVDECELFTSEEEKVVAVNPDYTEWKFSNQLIDCIKNLKGIVLQTTGYSYIDVDYCKSKNIVVTNIPKYSTEAVAEYAVFLMLAVARKLPLQIKNGWKQQFTPEFVQTQIKGKKAGILGLGTIGTCLAEKLTNLGMKVSYWSKNTRNKNYEYEDIEDLFENCDFIFPTFAVNAQTKLLITDELLNSMDENKSIISIVGTEIFNLHTALNNVKTGAMYGIAFEKADDDIANYEGNVMVTSPYAWYTKESFENLIEIWTQTMESFITNKPINQI